MVVPWYIFDWLVACSIPFHAVFMDGHEVGMYKKSLIPRKRTLKFWTVIFEVHKLLLLLQILFQNQGQRESNYLILETLWLLRPGMSFEHNVSLLRCCWAGLACFQHGPVVLALACLLSCLPVCPVKQNMLFAEQAPSVETRAARSPLKWLTENMWSLKWKLL